MKLSLPITLLVLFLSGQIAYANSNQQLMQSLQSFIDEKQLEIDRLNNGLKQIESLTANLSADDPIVVTAKSLAEQTNAKIQILIALVNQANVLKTNVNSYEQIEQIRRFLNGQESPKEDKSIVTKAVNKISEEYSENKIKTNITNAKQTSTPRTSTYNTNFTSDPQRLMFGAGIIGCVLFIIFAIMVYGDPNTQHYSE